jgi:hypothetical protein
MILDTKQHENNYEHKKNTKNIMAIKIKEKEYKNLRKLKKELDEILKNVVIEKRKQMTAYELLDLTRLKIRGGPKDLSKKGKFYIYSRK